MGLGAKRKVRSYPTTGYLYRSIRLMESFARAIAARTSRSGLDQVQRDYRLERGKLLDRHAEELDRMLAMRAREIEERLVDHGA